MKRNKYTVLILLSVLFCVGFGTQSALAFHDVPRNHWAVSVIDRAAEAKIMQGRDDGSFGLGDTVKRSEFAAMLNRLMGWTKSTNASPIFSDVLPQSWYFAEVQTLAEHGVVIGDAFRPEETITRREMAVMLVKALGYTSLAEKEQSCPFSDVTADRGYIALAHDFGIINGKASDIFDPDGSALREESAAMMIRMLDKYAAPLEEIHGFYALSSWGQRETAAQMDAVSFGWSRLEYTGNEVFLNTTAQNGNDWRIPQGYQDAVTFFSERNIPSNFAVTMTNSETAYAILCDPLNRQTAVDQLVTASTGYAGITIDFEGMKGEALKNGLNEFLSQLRTALGDRLLYVAVHPVLKNSSSYYDAYDYHTIGEYADRVILMAHDYAASSLDNSLLNTSFIATPVSPFDEVYFALKAITDPVMGVADPDKIQLAVSLSSTAAWETQNRKITNGKVIHPAMETIAKRLTQPDTEIVYSELYRNPYAWYYTENGQEILLWYEDSRSIADKICLARMFGINRLSVWRIGVISNSHPELYLNIWDTILGQRR